MLRTASVLAEYLDNDGDGEVDNPLVVQALAKNQATVLVYGTEAAVEAALEQSQVPDTAYTVHQDQVATSLIASAVVVRAPTVAGEEHGEPYVFSAKWPFDCKHDKTKSCDSPLEEVFHLVADIGFGQAYPSQFGLPNDFFSDYWDPGASELD